MTTKKLLFLTGAALLIGLSSKASAQSTASTLLFNNVLPASADLGFTYNVYGGAITLSALTNLAPGTTDGPLDFHPNPGPADSDPTTGTLRFVRDSNIYKAGMGVQSFTQGGSDGISGGGGDATEQMNFVYNNGGASLNTISLIINGLDFGTGANNGDDPVLFLNTTAGSYVIQENAIKAASTRNGASSDAFNSWTVNFGGFQGAVGSNATVTSFGLREVEGHTTVQGLTGGFVVPEPSSMLTIMAAAGFFVIRRRR